MTTMDLMELYDMHKTLKRMQFDLALADVVERDIIDAILIPLKALILRHQAAPMLSHAL